MSSGYTHQIKERILAAADGTVFVTSDFSDIADNNTVRQNMLRFVNDGILRRIMGGIFEKPKYSKLLGEYVAADPDAVAKALARRYHWTIAPCGTQLSICWVFRRRLRRFGPTLAMVPTEHTSGTPRALNSSTGPTEKLQDYRI